MIKLFYPNPEDIRARHLKEARIDLLDHQKLSEYHCAMVLMLQARIERINNDQAIEDTRGCTGWPTHVLKPAEGLSGVQGTSDADRS